MNKKIIVLVLLLVALQGRQQAHAQFGIGIITTVVKKVIQAIDLKIQQQQTKVIWLQNAQRTLENTMSQLDLKDISDWTSKYKQLYTDYFQELWKVKAVIGDFVIMKGIVQRQIELVNEYDHAWGLLKQDKNFTPQELKAMYSVYTGIINESMQNIDQLKLVVNSFATQMSDGERMALINDAGRRIENNLATLRKFNDHNARLSLSRATDLQQAEQLKQLYGL